MITYRFRSVVFNIFISITLGILFAGAFTLASVLWQGTDWIKDGEVISAQKVKDNFEYLYSRVGGNAIPICVGNDKGLQWDGSRFLCSDGNSTPPSSPLLVGGTHTSANCASSGGVTETSPEGLICKFAQASCPGGWVKHNAWSQTSANTCSYPGGDNQCEGNYCTTAFHAFGNAQTESCNYRRTFWVIGGWYGHCGSNGDPRTCYAYVNQIGCK